MVRPARRSRSLRHVTRRAPGGRNVTHYVEKMPKKAHCANCGVALSGVARARPMKIQNMAKSQKRPERPYAGMLCSKCMRRKIIVDARQ
ncbi:MAG: 50S ribosomal protein L34e, large subunit ribosomal protein L34e [archaeon GW2011_AR3]|nr:MAG: 50S ribosomal protein L34e, large subunit ribosomal protein L34e [archaeon GW2011_AR3]MBS3109362.1 50S ribosomal protein L34e [Candidatus Woesearchaeota archaeon]